MFKAQSVGTSYYFSGVTTFDPELTAKKGIVYALGSFPTSTQGLNSPEGYDFHSSTVGCMGMVSADRNQLNIGFWSNDDKLYSFDNTNIFNFASSGAS